MLGAFRPEPAQPATSAVHAGRYSRALWAPARAVMAGRAPSDIWETLPEPAAAGFPSPGSALPGLGSAGLASPGLSEPALPDLALASARTEVLKAGGDVSPATMPPLGLARAQLHENYIIAQTHDGMVIVDQHAAHERLVYERLKAARHEGGVRGQMLLIPEVVELDAIGAARMVEAAADLARLGLIFEPFGGNAVCVRETPAILGDVDCRRLIRDIADTLAEDESGSVGAGHARLEARIDAVLSRMACHGSVRSGRRLRAEEMDALLRAMEATPHAGQCNHGRPTYVELKLSDIERLFGRR